MTIRRVLALIILALAAVSAPASALASTATWSTPEVIDHSQGGLSAMSCVSVTACVAADIDGYVYRFSNDGWHASPRPVMDDARAISCRKSFCALAAGSHILESTGGNWRTALSAPSTIAGVSCGSETMCLGVAQSGRITRRTAAGWTRPSVAIAGYRAVTVACGSASFCAATFHPDGHPHQGFASIFDGSTWGPLASTGRTVATTMSCTSARFCLAGVGTSSVVYRHGGWSSPGQVGIDLVDVSCRRTSCMAVDDYSAAARWTDGAWSVTRVSSSDDGMRAVSCATASYCVGAAATGYVRTFHRSHWSRRRYIVHVTGGLADVSCAATTFCVAVDERANVFTFDGTTWSGPTLITRDRVGLLSVSCSATTFCVAVDSEDRSWRFDGHTWSLIPGELDRVPVELSCAPGGFCMAGSYDAPPEVLVHGRWSVAAGFRTHLPMTGLSCVDPQFCVAGGKGGHLWRWNGQHWRRFAATFGNGGFGISVSCGSRAFCLASDGGGRWRAYRNGSWGPPREVSPENSLADVQCVSATFCEAAAGPVTLRFDGTRWVSEPLPSGFYAYDVACASESLCVALSDDGASMRTVS